MACYGQKSKFADDACPVLHWRTCPKTSRLSLRSWKCFKGLRDGWMQFEMANLPSFREFFHSFCQSFVVAVLVLLLALDLVVLKGIWHPRDVASFANESALSLPWMLQWLGAWGTILI